MKRARRSIALVLACLAGLTRVAQAAPNSAARIRAFAALPDWSGFWEQDSVELGLGGEPKEGDRGFQSTQLLHAHPPYNAQWEARYRAYQKAPPRPRCEFGFPAIMESPFSQFEMVVTPEQTLFIPVWLPATRQIFTDGREHPGPDDLLQSPMGDSIGHWERETLVVDTIGRTPEAISDRNVLSDQAHFIERIRLVSPERMEDQMTIEDPVALAHPWRVTLTYRRVKSVDRLVPADCDSNDRNPIVNGQYTIAPSAQH
jgi:hypothetical protein